MKLVKVLVAQLCPTLWDPMDSLPVHGLLCPWNSPGKNTGVGSHYLLQWIFLTHGSNLGLLHCRQIFYCLSHPPRKPQGPLSLRYFRKSNGNHAFTLEEMGQGNERSSFLSFSRHCIKPWCKTGCSMYTRSSDSAHCGGGTGSHTSPLGVPLSGQDRVMRPGRIY